VCECVCVRVLSFANKQIAERDAQLQQHRNTLLQADRHSARAAGELRGAAHEIATFQAEITELVAKSRGFETMRLQLQECETRVAERDVQIRNLVRDVLQCVAVCCSVLQRVAACCSESHCVAVSCSVLQECETRVAERCAQIGNVGRDVLQ